MRERRGDLFDRLEDKTSTEEGRSEIKEFLKNYGKIMIVVGLLMTVVGIGLFMSNFFLMGRDIETSPSFFITRTIIGMGLMTIGWATFGMGLMGVRLAMARTMTNYMAGEVSPAIRSASTDFGRGFSMGTRRTSDMGQFTNAAPFSFCDQCGKKVGSASRFCRNCGAKLS